MDTKSITQKVKSTFLAFEYKAFYFTVISRRLSSQTSGEEWPRRSDVFIKNIDYRVTHSY